MKIKNRENIFGHHLGNLLATGDISAYHSSEPASAVKAKKFTQHILKIADGNIRNKVLNEYITVLSLHVNTPVCKRLATRLFRAISKSTVVVSKEIKKQMDALQSQLANDEGSKKGKKKHPLQVVSKKYGEYPNEEVSIRQLKEKSNDRLRMQSIMKAINKDAFSYDTDLVKQLADARDKVRYGHVTFAYLKNRIKKLNASKIELAHHVNLVLSAHPRENELSAHFLHAIIKSKCSVWFSLNELNEARIDVPFWLEDTLKTRSNLKGWKISCKPNVEVIEAEDFFGESCPKLVKSIFRATKKGKKPREITHYHYEHWKDGTKAPSDSLLLKCTQIALKHLENPKAFVGINCMAGIGRTGTLANIIYAAKMILDQKNEGKPIEEISINLANNNYELKKERPYLLSSNVAQYMQVHRVVQDFALSL